MLITERFSAELESFRWLHEWFGWAPGALYFLAMAWVLLALIELCRKASRGGK